LEFHFELFKIQLERSVNRMALRIRFENGQLVFLDCKSLLLFRLLNTIDSNVPRMSISQNVISRKKSYNIFVLLLIEFYISAVVTAKLNVISHTIISVILSILNTK